MHIIFAGPLGLVQTDGYNITLISILERPSEPTVLFCCPFGTWALITADLAGTWANPGYQEFCLSELLLETQDHCLFFLCVHLIEAIMSVPDAVAPGMLYQDGHWATVWHPGKGRWWKISGVLAPKTETLTLSGQDHCCSSIETV